MCRRPRDERPRNERCRTGRHALLAWLAKVAQTARALYKAAMNVRGLRATAGQVLIAGFGAGAVPDSLRSAAAAGELGGFILFKRNVGSLGETAQLTQDLRGLCPVDLPPWIAVDQEGGRVARLGRPLLRLPPMRQLGARDDVAFTQHAAQVLGAQLALLGFNTDFAPVLDIDTNPDNPVIGDRSFGTDPARVTRHGLAFAAGLQAAGVIACGKHFPGHGDTDLDSHLALPRLSHDRARLDAVELFPFAAAKNAIDAIMTAHVVFDAIDPSLPATLCRAAITGILREQLGYTGVIVSDDLEMKAVADHYGVGDAACRAIDAGCDAVLICSKPELCVEAHEALVARAEANSEFARRLEQAAQRGLRLRQHRARQATAVSPEQAEPLLHALNQRLDVAQIESALGIV